MRALILAAGRGTRLGLPGDGPKCLADIGGRTILSRSLDALDALGVPATIVVGHAASMIESHVSERRRIPALVQNPRYKEGSVVSLAAGLATLATGAANALRDDLLLMDGDVAYTPELLDRLVKAAAKDALLVDIGTEFTDEQYMAGLRGDRVVRLTRGRVDGHDAHGEWVGFTKLSATSGARLRAAITAQIASGATSGGYEDALAGLLEDIAFTAVPTQGLPWVEIDFANDLAEARRLFGG